MARSSPSLGQPVVIENRPGGAGVVAGETIAKGTPDGYTLAVATSAVMAIRPTLFKQRPFDPLTESSSSWILVPPEDGAKGGVYNIKSGAPGVDRSGKPYADW